MCNLLSRYAYGRITSYMTLSSSHHRARICSYPVSFTFIPSVSDWHDVLLTLLWIVWTVWRWLYTSESKMRPIIKACLSGYSYKQTPQLFILKNVNFIKSNSNLKQVIKYWCYFVVFFHSCLPVKLHVFDTQCIVVYSELNENRFMPTFNTSNTSQFLG